MGNEALNCKSCGAALKPGSSVCECEYCGTLNILTGDTGKFINQLNRANKLRQDKEFDRAIKVYDDILAENTATADVLWSRTLCEYGIEYVPDPASSKYIPTLHRIKDESILNNSSYLEALKICDEKQKDSIEKEANIIADIQNKYLDIVSKETPYDVFICYKETDDSSNEQTEDSGIGLDLYERLVNYGLKVFFSRVTLQDKLGINYEPYIYGALKSSKVMVVIGTKAEYFISPWVKNEWSRFLKQMETDKQKQMFFACDDVEDLPRAFSGRQAQILNQPNSVQNLAYSVKNYLSQIGEKKEAKSNDISEVQKFTQQLAELERKNRSNLGGMFGASKPERTILDFIRNYPVPDTKKDCLDFMILATSNINYAVIQGQPNSADSFSVEQIKGRNEVWKAKAGMIYQKAKALFGNDPEFSQIGGLYDDMLRKIKTATTQEQKKRKNTLIICFSLLGFLFLMSFMMIFIGTCSLNHEEKVKESLPDHQLYVVVKSDPNLFLSTYDIEISIDGKEIGTVSNGKEFKKEVTVKEGEVRFEVEKVGDYDVDGYKYITVEGDTTFECHLKSKGSEIEIKDINITEGINK